MKKLLLASLIGVASFTGFGQGTVVMNTFVNAANSLRASNTVAGTWASGPFLVGLYWGADAGSVNNLAGATAAFLTTPATAVGYVTGAAASGGGSRVTGITPGSTGYFQIKAWSSGYATYADALASGNSSVLVGTGPIVTSATGGAGSPPSAAVQIQWGAGQVFNLVPVPEPSVIALGVLGLAGVLFLRRRK